MAINKSKSVVRQDYEIVIRKRGESQLCSILPSVGTDD